MRKITLYLSPEEVERAIACYANDVIGPGVYSNQRYDNPDITLDSSGSVEVVWTSKEG